MRSCRRRRGRRAAPWTLSWAGVLIRRRGEPAGLLPEAVRAELFVLECLERPGVPALGGAAGASAGGTIQLR